MFFWNRYFDPPRFLSPIREGDSFNPCFSGIGISTFFVCCFMVLLPLFQSLFFWNRYFDNAIFICPLFWSGCFNPCFSGIGISTRSENAPACRRQCFNPCFSGIGISTEIMAKWIYTNLKVSILVFLESVFRRNSFSPFTFTFFSFNPCFSGIGISTDVLRTPRLAGDNVSILVFLESVFRPNIIERVKFDSLTFQSLFFWNRYFDWYSKRNNKIST